MIQVLRSLMQAGELQLSGARWLSAAPRQVQKEDGFPVILVDYLNENNILKARASLDFLFSSHN